MAYITNIISIITLSGFSNAAEHIISLLRFPVLLSEIEVLEIYAWLLMLLIAAGPKSLAKCFLYIKKSIINRIHPNAVVTLKLRGKVLSDKEAYNASLRVVSVIALQVLFIFILSFNAASITEAMLTAAAVTSNCAWLLLIIGKTSLLSNYSTIMQILICIALIIFRIPLYKKIIRALTKKRS